MSDLTDALRNMLRGEATEAADEIERLTAERDAALADADRFKADYMGACRTVALMHEAATGRSGEAPHRGVVEDVADMKAERDAIKDQQSREAAVVIWATGEVEKIIAERDALRKDAERYRWLRSTARKEDRDGGWSGLWRLPLFDAWNDSPNKVYRIEHRTFDAAIDSAMAE